MLYKLASFACGDPKLARKLFPQQKSQFYASHKLVGFLKDEKELEKKAVELKCSVQEVPIEPIHTILKDWKLVTKDNTVILDMTELKELKTVDKKPKKERKESSLPGPPVKLRLYGNLGNKRTHGKVEAQVAQSKVLSSLIEFSTKSRLTDVVVGKVKDDKLPESLVDLMGKVNFWKQAWLDNLLNNGVRPGCTRENPEEVQEKDKDWLETLRFPGTLAPSAIPPPKPCIVLESGEGNQLPTQASADPNEDVRVSFVEPRVVVFKKLEGIKENIKKECSDLTINFTLFQDNTVSLNKSIGADLISLTIPKEFTKSEEAIVLTLDPIIVGKSKDLYETRKQSMAIKTSILASLLLKPLEVNGKKYTFILDLFPGDSKSHWALLSKVSGGNLRCTQCKAGFSQDNIQNLCHAHHYLDPEKVENTSVKDFFDFFADKEPSRELQKEGEANGLASTPYFLFYLDHIFHKNGKRGYFRKDLLPKMLVASDNLHPLRGWIVHLLKELIENQRLDEIMLKNRLLNSLKRGSLADLNGEDARVIVLLFEEVVIPCLTYDYNKGKENKIGHIITKIFRQLQLINWIAYAPLSAQSYRGIRLLLHVSCFLLSLAVAELPTDLEVMDLYLHIILAHYGDSFERNSFIRMGSEEGEKFLSKVKHTLRYLTNRKVDQALNEVFVRHFAEIQVDFLLDSNKEKPETLNTSTNPPTNKKFSKFREILAALEDIELEIPDDFDNSNRAHSIRTFVSKMLGLGYTKDLIQEREGKYIFLVSKDVKSFLEKTERPPRRSK